MNNIKYSNHALKRLSERQIKESTVNEILNDKSIIKRNDNQIIVTSFRMLKELNIITVLVIDTLNNKIVTVYNTNKKQVLNKYCYW
jgi:carbamoylphosphate synthase large subunit